MSPPGGNRVVLVTGATSGIGFHTARELAARGASVLITGRDGRRGEDAVRAIALAAGHARVDCIQADQVCVELAWTASPAVISGRYITEHGKPGKYPAAVADPAVQDQAVSTAEDLAQHAPTAAGHIGLG